MIKIDLHIHTLSSLYEGEIIFSLNKLKEYVKVSALDVIAITNHNLFDKTQYNMIKNSFDPSITVLPGIEIDIEKSHLLLICEEDHVDVLANISKELKKMINGENDCIDFDTLSDLIGGFNDYIIIPHYEKSPKMKSSTLKKFDSLIYCGEVRSAKQFEVVKKQSDKLIPVLFSDIRITDDLKNYPSRFTYLDVTEKSFSVIKNALRDRNKVFLSRSKVDTMFEYLPDGTVASSKLNVILGKRSTGKTFNLNMLYLLNEDNNIKYIKQFSLTGKSEEEKFEKLLEHD